MIHPFSDLPELNLPPFDVKLRHEAQRTQIFDAFRNKFVNLSPEEWVRQHMLQYLNSHLMYPRNSIAVEVPLRLNGLSKRADIVVYSRGALPWMIVECKAASVPLSQAVFDQAARYNLTMQVPYLVVTNGLQLRAAAILFREQTVKMLTELPAWGNGG